MSPSGVVAVSRRQRHRSKKDVRIICTCAVQIVHVPCILAVSDKSVPPAAANVPQLLAATLTGGRDAPAILATERSKTGKGAFLVGSVSPDDYALDRIAAVEVEDGRRRG